jgi:hypothetical protein
VRIGSRSGHCPKFFSESVEAPAQSVNFGHVNGDLERRSLGSATTIPESLHQDQRPSILASPASGRALVRGAFDERQHGLGDFFHRRRLAFAELDERCPHRCRYLSLAIVAAAHGARSVCLSLVGSAAELEGGPVDHWIEFEVQSQKNGLKPLAFACFKRACRMHMHRASFSRFEGRALGMDRVAQCVGAITVLERCRDERQSARRHSPARELAQKTFRAAAQTGRR